MSAARRSLSNAGHRSPRTAEEEKALVYCRPTTSSKVALVVWENRNSRILLNGERLKTEMVSASTLAW